MNLTKPHIFYILYIGVEKHLFVIHSYFMMLSVAPAGAFLKSMILLFLLKLDFSPKILFAH